jgi:hypothetical protein
MDTLPIKAGSKGSLSVKPLYGSGKSEWGKVGNTKNPEFKTKRTAGLANKAVGKPAYGGKKEAVSGVIPKYKAHAKATGKPLYKGVKSKKVVD